MRKHAVKLKIQQPDKDKDSLSQDKDEISPTSPESPGLLITSPKFKDQESIELDLSQKIEKVQDYTLINRFFSFLDVKLSEISADPDAKSGDKFLNSTLSGYFCRVCLIIIS